MPLLDVLGTTSMVRGAEPFRSQVSANLRMDGLVEALENIRPKPILRESLRLLVPCRTA